MSELRSCPYAVEQLLPQAPPMVLIDRVVGWHETGLVAALTVREDGLFFQAGRGVAAHVAIEWMAQSCAAFVGLQAKHGGKPVKIGFLLGTRGFAAELSWFRLGDAILVEVTQTFLDVEMAVFDCSVRINGEIAATAALTVYQPRDLNAVLSLQGIALAGNQQ